MIVVMTSIKANTKHSPDNNKCSKAANASPHHVHCIPQWTLNLPLIRDFWVRCLKTVTGQGAPSQYTLGMLYMKEKTKHTKLLNHLCVNLALLRKPGSFWTTFFPIKSIARERIKEVILYIHCLKANVNHETKNLDHHLLRNNSDMKIVR